MGARKEVNERVVDKAWELNHQVDFSTGEEPEALNMIGGVHFVRWAMGLQEKRLTASKKVQEYNLYCPKGATVESLAKGQKHLLVMILGRLGEESEIQPPLSLVYGCNTSVGQEVYAESGLSIIDSTIVSIGNRVFIGPSVTITTLNQPTDVASRQAYVTWAEPVTIGEDCWIGARVTILPGVSIGKGCVIEAGAVVGRDVPDFALARGVPAKVVGKVNEVQDW